ncbi:MAG: hypothetical protein WCX77_02590 [Candidatus Paceibacterota bacterium]|jgi:hypothetical protein
MVFQEIISYLNSSPVQGFLLPFKIIFILLSIFFAGAISYFIHKAPGDILSEKQKYSDLLFFNNFKKASDTKFKKTWKKACQLLKNDLEPEYKLAVLEAYALFSDFLAQRDWNGGSLAAQLDSARSDKDFMFDRGNILRLSNLRDNIVADKNYRLDMKEVKNLFTDIEGDIKRAEE